MIVLPMGLGTNLKRFPLVTALLGLLWVAVFAVDRSSDAILTKLLRSVAQSGVRDEARHLFVDYCKSRKGSLSRCMRYSVLVWTGFPGREAETKKKQVRGSKADDAAMKTLGAEHERAQKLRTELGDCGSSRRCFVYKDILWRFMDQSRHTPTAFAKLGSYKPYAAALASYKKRLRDICRVHACLVTTNINVPSLVAAQLRHGGLGHLFGNLLIFIIFGIYVEQRTSRVAYLLTTIVGGTVGMGVHAAFFSNGESMALGGSANVSTVLGMFFVFFLHQKMSFRVWLPRRLYTGTSFRAPVMLCFPLIFVLSDITGGFDNGFAELSSSRVAHFAHLSGLLCGMLTALVISRLNRVSSPFIYESELKDMRTMVQSRDLGEILRLANGMVCYNPDNVPAMAVACTGVLQLAAVAGPGEHLELMARGRQFITDHLQTVCAVAVRTGDFESASRLLAQMPMSMPYHAYLGRLGQVTALRLGDFALSQGRPLQALRVYDYFLTRFPLSRTCDRVLETVAGIVGCLSATPETVAALTLFLGHHPESQIGARLGAWIANAQMAQPVRAQA